MSDAREALIQTVLRTAVAQAALQAGAVGISQGSLDTLSDVILRCEFVSSQAMCS